MVVTFSRTILPLVAGSQVQRSTEVRALTENLLIDNFVKFVGKGRLHWSHHIELFCFFQISHTCVDVGHSKMTYLEDK